MKFPSPKLLSRKFDNVNKGRSPGSRFVIGLPDSSKKRGNHQWHKEELQTSRKNRDKAYSCGNSSGLIEVRSLKYEVGKTEFEEKKPLTSNF